MAGKYANRVHQKQDLERRKPKASYKLDPSDEIFRLHPADMGVSD